MKLNEMLNIKYPFIQGGMAHIATGSFAAAVSNAGGIGLIGSGGMTLEQLREEIEICKSLTDKPFGVNIMLMHYEVDQIADLVCEYGIKLVTTGAGNPGKYMKKWKEHGILVFPVVSSKALAIRMERAGADGVIAEGAEAGGHIGELTTMVLMGELIDSINIPIIAAGGIGSGRQILACKALGAVGIQMGTMLLATEECPIHDNYKERVLRAKSNQVTVIGRIKGHPIRQLKNEMSNEYIAKEKSDLDSNQLEELVFGALRNAVKNGDVDRGSAMCGQVVDSAREIVPVKQLFSKLYNEYLQEKDKLCQK